MSWINNDQIEVRAIICSTLYLGRPLKEPTFNFRQFQRFIEAMVNEILFYDVTHKWGSIAGHVSDSTGLYLDTETPSNSIEFYNDYPESIYEDNHKYWVDAIGVLKTDILSKHNDIKHNANINIEELDTLVSLNYVTDACAILQVIFIKELK